MNVCSEIPVRSDSAMSLTASESSDSEPTPADVPLDAFESDGNFAAAAIQLMGHFLAPERIPPPALASDSEAEDGEAEEIEDYTANLRFTSPIGKYPLFFGEAHARRIYIHGFVRHIRCRRTSARSHGHGLSR